MTKVIVVNGENGENDNGKLILPVAGAEYIGLYNNTLNKVKNNFAPFKKTASSVGSISVNSSASFKSQTNYLQTEIDETEEMTTFVVAKSTVVPSDNSSAFQFISNYKTPPKDGSSSETINSFLFGVGATGKLSTLICQGNSAADASGLIAASAVQNWTASEHHLCVARVTNTRVEHFDKSKNYNIYADLNKPRYLASGKLRIGSSYTSYAGSVDMALLIHYSRALSDSEIEQVTSWIRSYMSTKSITV